MQYIQVYAPLKKLNDATENDHYAKNPFFKERTRSTLVPNSISNNKTAESTQESILLIKSASLMVYTQCRRTLQTQNDQSFLNVRMELENNLIPAKSLVEIKIWGDDIVEESKQNAIDLLTPNLLPTYKAMQHSKSMCQPSSATTFKFLPKLSEETRSQLALVGDLKPVAKSAYMVKEITIKRPIKATDKTVIFDMDDTLIYSYSMLSSKRKASLSSNIRTISLNKININFAIRPYLYEMLAKLQPYFEIIVFTASQQNYADEVLNTLDPYDKWFNCRLYRSNCVANQNMLVKDLRVLQRNLRKVVIVDNSILSFSAQLDNGIPVSSFTGDSGDRELESVTQYLMNLRYVDDVREVNKEAFHLCDLVSYCKACKDR